jgi:hypothetical protein
MQHVAQRILSRNWGSSQLAKLRDLQFNTTVSAGVGSLFLGNQSHSPRSGNPLRFCDTVFPGVVPSRKRYCYSIYGSQASYTFVYTIIFWVRFPKWHAAGRDTHYFLKTSAVGGEVQTLQASRTPAYDLFYVPGNLSFFHSVWGSLRIHFGPVDTAEMIYPPCSNGLPANLLLRKPNRRVRSLAACSDWWTPRGSLLK